MYKLIKLRDDKQSEVVRHVTAVAQDYEDRMQERHAVYMSIYEALNKFKGDKKAAWQSTYKVNKAFEVVNKVTPRIISQPPKWIVSVKTSEWDGEDIMGDITQYERTREYAAAIQDYLDASFSKGDLKEVLRLFAKSGVIYGNSFAKICYKYKIQRTYSSKEVELIEDDMIVGTETEYEVDEDVFDEYPTLEVKSWDDVLYDPRYVRFEDMPCIIDNTRGIRLSHFTKNSKKYMNVEKLVDLCMQEYEGADQYRQRVYAITGIDGITTKVDKNKLFLRSYYGYYELDGEDGKEEKLYQFEIVNDLVLVSAREISMIPFEDFKVFEDTETHFATGFVEPILGLQEELNFKKNSASQYISSALNRTWIWSPNSGVDPRKLTSAPGNIIPTSRTAQEALANLVELPHRTLQGDYFQEQNDIERQIQASTFTVDVTTPRSEQGLTQTATGIRVKMYETNTVMEEVKRHFEETMARLAYKFLQFTFENLQDNLIIKKMGKEGYWQMNKEAMKNAMSRYEIRMEAGSSSYDTIEERRSNALAKWNLSLQAAQAGVPVNLEKVWKDVMETFEGTNPDKLLKPVNPMQAMQEAPGGMPRGNLEMPQEGDPALEQTQAIAGGFPQI